MTAPPASSGSGATSLLIVGATGLVGRECVRRALGDPAFARVVVLTRRPFEMMPRPPALDAHVVDFERLDAHAPLFAVDAIICALGTTIRQAGSRARFRRVDLEYPLAVARIGLERGARHFLLVSSLGADARSRVFYSRVKGEVEDALLAMPYRAVTIARPSLLLGERAEFRLGEEIAKRLAPLIPRAYKPVPATAVAAALVRAAREDRPGHRIIESAEIRRLAGEEAR